MNNSTVTIDNVLIVRESELGWLCEIQGQPTFVGRLQVPVGTSMPPVGVRGRITLTVVGAYDLGLAAPQRAYG